MCLRVYLETKNALYLAGQTELFPAFILWIIPFTFPFVSSLEGDRLRAPVTLTVTLTSLSPFEPRRWHNGRLVSRHKCFACHRDVMELRQKKSGGLFSFVFFPLFGQSIVNGDLNKWHKTCFVSLLQSDDLSLCSHVTKWRPTETQWEFQLRLETLFKTLADPEIPQKLFLPVISGPFF